VVKGGDYGGPIAISTRSRNKLVLRPNTVATWQGMASAPNKLAPGRGLPASLGPEPIVASIRAASFPKGLPGRAFIAVSRLVGIARHSHRAATTWRSNRSPAGKTPASSSVLATDSRVEKSEPARRSIAFGCYCGPDGSRYGTDDQKVVLAHYLVGGECGGEDFIASQQIAALVPRRAKALPRKVA